MNLHLLNPSGLWFLFLLPVIVIFYLLKRKRVVQLVSSTFLWQRFLAESQASAPFQRLRKNWLLLFQLLLLCALILALARPFIPANVRPAQRRIVILDASASMQATDVKPSRFERAREEALRWVDNLKEGEEMVVVQAGADTRVRQSATQNRNALRRALLACVPSDGPTRLVPALQMAESLVRDQSGAEIHLFSDGATAALNEFENKGLPLVFHKIGGPGNNIAITAIDSRANPPNPGERAIYINVTSFSEMPQQGTIELLKDDAPVETRSVTVPAGQSLSEVFTHPHSGSAVYSVRLSITDDLALDNRASLVAIDPGTVRVLLVTPGNRLLERALRAVPRTQLAVTARLDAPAEGFDLVVLDGVEPLIWPQANILAFRVSSTNWFTAAQKIENPGIVDWRSTHPLLRYAGFEDVGIAQSIAVQTPSWAVSLLDSPSASLMLAGELGRQRIVWAGFDVLESNWPLRVSFPIFIANAVQWLSPEAVQGGNLMVKAGDPFRYRLSQPIESAVVIAPSGKQERISIPAASPEFVYGNTLEQGVYHASIGTNQITFCVNLLDSNESNIRAKEDLRLGSRNLVSAAVPQKASVEIWRGLAVFGLCVLLGEWWFYHRRTA